MECGFVGDFLKYTWIKSVFIGNLLILYVFELWGYVDYSTNSQSNFVEVHRKDSWQMYIWVVKYTISDNLYLTRQEKIAETLKFC